MPSAEEMAQQSADRLRELQALHDMRAEQIDEIMVLLSDDPTRISQTDLVELDLEPRKPPTIECCLEYTRRRHAEVLAVCLIGWLKIGADVERIDSLALTLSQPALQKELDRLAILIRKAIDVPVEPDTISCWSDLMRCDVWQMIPVLQKLIDINNRYGISLQGAFVGGVHRGTVIPPWYLPEQIAGTRGPGRDVTNRARVWGHYLASHIFGEQRAALRFWHEYDNGALSYSYRGQDPCSPRAHAHLSMEKTRLFADLEKIGVRLREPGALLSDFE